MDTPLIITIGREYGSGGHEIGSLVASKLGIDFYDKQLITLAAEKSGLSHDYIEQNEQRSKSSFIQNMAASTAYANGFFSTHYLPLSEAIFISQAQVIRDVATKGPAVIVGRCSDYILREHPRHLSVFIRANYDDRVKFLMERNGISMQEAKDLIEHTDAIRSDFHNFYAETSWGDARAYDMCVNSSILGIEKTADLVLDFAVKALNIQ